MTVSLPLTLRRAYGELLFAAVLWGLSFIAARWALSGISPFLACLLRFLIAFVVGGTLMLLIPRLRGNAPLYDFKKSWIAGMALGLTIQLQMQGLQYTAVANSAFITTLYVVFVPIVEWIHFKIPLSLRNGMNILLALIGTAFICQIEFGKINPGDLLTLACAIVSAYHIVIVGLDTSKIGSAFAYNVGQAMWAALIMIPGVLLFETPHAEFNVETIGGLIILAVLVHLIAFTIQVRAQRILRPMIVSMFFLLESPFATIFAFLIFRERMDTMQWLGALLILGAAYRASTDPRAV